MLNFCTLFDSNYLTRGLVMYDSLVKYSGDFHLYVFAFNDTCFEVLTRLNLPAMTVISLQEFEDQELLSVKSGRSRAEYCWTCTSSTIQYVLDHFATDNCTYLDADLRFYSNPQVLIDEMENSGKAVLITLHRYTRRYDQSRLRGKYCVQFMYFKNNKEGREVLSWWRERCIEWCFARVEDGKFGDQKYLDDWTARFPSVHELEHPGGGIAPWNCQQYQFKSEKQKITLSEKGLQGLYEAVFFHFHGLKLYHGDKVLFAPRSYQLSEIVQKLFYRPYTDAIIEKGKELEKHFPGRDFHSRGTARQYLREKWLIGHYSWLKRNIWGRIFPPRLA